MSEPQKSPARAIQFDGLTFAPRFEYGDQAQAVEICGTGDGSELGTGFARLTNAEFPWTIKYDEILLVVEGNVTVETKQGSFSAGPKDCIWLQEIIHLFLRMFLQIYHLPGRMIHCLSQCRMLWDTLHESNHRQAGSAEFHPMVKTGA